MSAVPDQAVAVEIDDDRKLEELGYIPSFKREFSNLATVSLLFSKGFLFPAPDETGPDQLCVQHHGIPFGLKQKKNKPLSGSCARVSAAV